MLLDRSSERSEQSSLHIFRNTLSIAAFPLHCRSLDRCNAHQAPGKAAHIWRSRSVSLVYCGQVGEGQGGIAEQGEWVLVGVCDFGQYRYLCILFTSRTAGPAGSREVGYEPSN